jgi:hypothetical protein
MSALNNRVLVSALLFFVSPAIAFAAMPAQTLSVDQFVIKVVCAEGSKNCFSKDAGHIKAGKQVEKDLQNNGEQDCKGGGVCGNAASGGGGNGGTPAVVKSSSKGSVAPIGSQHNGKH